MIGKGSRNKRYYRVLIRKPTVTESRSSQGVA